jgi:hypothetical protein
VQSVTEAAEGVYTTTLADEVDLKPMQDYLISRLDAANPVTGPTPTLNLQLLAGSEPLEGASSTVELAIVEVQGVPDPPTENISDFVLGMAKLWADRNQSTPVEVTGGSAAIDNGDQTVNEEAAIDNGDQVALLDEAGDHYWVHVIQAADEPSEGAYGWVKMQYVDAPEEGEGEEPVETEETGEPVETEETEELVETEETETSGESGTQSDTEQAANAEAGGATGNEAAERATERVEDGDE